MGTASGLGVGFSDIQDLVGGSSSSTTTFSFGSGGSITGGVNALNTNGTNSIMYADYPNVSVFLSDATNGYANGYVMSNGQFITDQFGNINNLVGNGQSYLQVPGSLMNSIIVTGAGQGYINDPTNFSGFSNFDGQNTSTVTFNSQAVTTSNPNTFMVGGTAMTFTNVNQFSGNIVNPSPNPTPTPTPTPPTPPVPPGPGPIPPDNFNTDVAAVVTPFSGPTDYAYPNGYNVNQNISNIVNNQIIIDTTIQKWVDINCVGSSKNAACTISHLKLSVN